MGFIDNITDAVDAVGDATGDTLGFVMDLAKSQYNKANIVETQDQLKYTPAGQQTEVARALARLKKQERRFAVNRREYVEDHKTLAAIGGAAKQAVVKPIQALGYGAHMVQRGTSTLIQDDGPINVPGFGTNLKSPGIKDAWKNSARVSAGQSAIVASGKAPEGANFKNAWRYGDQTDPLFDQGFSLRSGTLDTLMVFSDPLIVAGKAAHLLSQSRKTLTADDVAAAASDTRATTRRGRRAQDDAQSIIDATAGTDAAQNFRLFRDKGINNASGLASVLAAAKNEPEMRRLVVLTALGDRTAKATLTQQRASLVDQIDAMNVDLNDLVVPKGLRTPDKQGLFDFDYDNTAERFAVLQRQRDDMEQGLDEYNRILPDEDRLRQSREMGTTNNQDDIGLFGSIQKRTRIGKRDLRWMESSTAYYLQPGVAGVVQRVGRSPINNRPGGWVPFHDADTAIREVDALTRRTPGLPPEQRAAMMDRFVKAPDDNARRGVLESVEDEIFTHLGKFYGYDDVDVRELVTKFMSERQAAVLHHKQQTYGYNSEGVAVKDALLETQLQNGAPTIPIDLIKKVLRRNNGRYRALKNVSSQGFSMVEELGDVVNDLWRFEALFRGGYPIRNAIDSQMRMLAFLGAQRSVALQIENAGAGIRRTRQVGREGVVDGLRSDAVPVMGQGTRQVGPYTIPDAMSATRDQANLHMKEISSAESIAMMFGSENGKNLNKLRGSGSFASKRGDEAGWEDDYLRVVNQHFRQSVITQRLLRGESPEAIVRYLRSGEGRSLRRRMVFGTDTPEALVLRNIENLNHALPKEYWARAAERPFTTDDIAEIWEDAAKRPPINAEQVAYSQGEGGVAEFLGEIRDYYFNAVSKMTDDAMGRHPLYVSLYRGQMVELMKRADPKMTGMLDEVEQKIIEEQARTWARREMKSVLFDISQKSDLAHFTRFIMPFYAAWQDAVTKYSKLIIRDPSNLGWFAQGWTAPNDSSLIEVVDSSGKPVPSDKSKLSDDEGVRIPKGVAEAFGIPWTSTISKSSFNIALQGDPIWAPGWGPMGQGTVNEIIKKYDSPELAKYAEEFGILPFGVVENDGNPLKYFAAGALRQQAMPEGRRSRIVTMVMQADAFEAARDGRKPASAKEIQDRVDGLMKIRTLTSMLSPFAVQYSSPYQFYIDQSRAYDSMVGPGKRFKDFSEADAAFLKDFGSDYYKFRMSQSNTNVPIAASTRADKAARKVADLVSSYPRFAPLFIGPNNTGEYNRNVYTLQSMRKIGLTNKTWRDSFDDPKEALTRNQVEQGWLEYNKISDLIEAQVVARGLPSLRVKAAADLRQLKAEWVETIAGRDGPDWGRSWYRDYNDFGSTGIVEFFDAASAAVADKRINQRQDIKTLAEYLKGRAMVRKELQARKKAGGSGTLTTESNADLNEMWSVFTGTLVEADLTFAEVYNRYLERDDLTKVVK